MEINMIILNLCTLEVEIRYDEDVWEVLTRELLDNQTTNEECK